MAKDSTPVFLKVCGPVGKVQKSSLKASAAAAPTGSIKIIVETNATVEYSINGKTGPFKRSPFFGGLAAGTYKIAVRPVAACQTGCSSSPVVEFCEGNGAVGCAVIETVPPIGIVVVPQDCITGKGGSITITMTTGTPPYLYSIDGGASFQESNVFENLPAGDYVVVVEDATGLRISIPVTVTSIRSVTGNPITDFISQKYCDGCTERV